MVVSDMRLGLGIWLVVTRIRYMYRQHTTKHCQQQMQDSADGSSVFVTANRRWCIFPTMNPSLGLRCEPFKTPKSLISLSSMPNVALQLPLSGRAANIEIRQRGAD
jgi:hypothetical protein